MNLREQLKNLFPAEISQASDVESTTISGTMSKKTVDEVWSDIQQNKRGEERSSGQPTLGEMTLEDFLLKAGVAAGHASFAQGLHWLQQQSAMEAYVPARPVPQSFGVGPGHAIDAACQESQVSIPSPIMGMLSDTQTLGRKRVAAEELAEKSVERRHKRMIKNRESAARSRARKQAYTTELENKVSRLEEENERLRKQKLDNILYCEPPPEPKHQLHRTSSAPF